jgi:acetylornithine deacetylase
MDCSRPARGVKGPPKPSADPWKVVNVDVDVGMGSGVSEKSIYRTSNSFRRIPKTPVGSTTINPAVIKGGRHPAFIADECKLWITVHFLPNEKYENVVKEVEDHILKVSEGDVWLRDNPPKFKWGGVSMTRDEGETFPSYEVDLNHEGVKTLMESHKAVTGVPPEIAVWPSVSDAGWLSWAGIPTVNYGPGSLKQAHVVDEYIKLEDVYKATKILALTLLKWCGYDG